MKIYAITLLNPGILIHITGQRSIYLGSTPEYLDTYGNICRITLSQGSTPILPEQTSEVAFVDVKGSRYIDIDFTQLQSPTVSSAEELRDFLVSNLRTAPSDFSLALALGSLPTYSKVNKFGRSQDVDAQTTQI